MSMDRTLDILDRNGLHPDDGAVSLDGFADAVIGVDMLGRIVYSYDLLVGMLVADGYDVDEAAEWIDYNISGFYMGEMSPVIVTDRVGRMADARKEQ